MAALTPAPLYGRRKAIARLTHACRQVNPEHPVWILTEGPAGIGKTSLVAFVRAALQLSPTQYGAGKFEQFHRQTPYGALIVALRKLLQAVMVLPEPLRLEWRDILRGGAESQLAPLTDVLPELVFLLGALPVPAPLPPQQAQERLEAAFAHFIGCFARDGHPLLLFLDDLQWADVGTLRLLRNLDGAARLGQLIVLGTFRDNEVTALHPLTQLLETLEKQALPPVRIRLAPLSAADIEEWLADVYGVESPAAAAWLQQQSEGNPLFVSQLLGTLRERAVLHRDGGAWQWDAARLAEARLADNILCFMEARLRELSLEQQGLLSCAASMGTEFGEDELMCILGLAREQVQSQLARTKDAQLTEHVRDGNWRFAHDRIQQAAYRLLPEEQRREQHLRIGRLLLAATTAQALDAASFDLAAQFNQAIELLTPEERLTVADLNLRAGRRAKNAAAFEAALGYFRAGHTLLPESAWRSHYPLIFELVKESAECAYATGELKLAGQLFDEALAHARERLDRARIYGIMIMFALNGGHARDAWDYGSTCLAEFGIALGGDNDAMAAAIEREEPLLRQRLATAVRLFDEPAHCSAEQEAVADLLLGLYVAGYQLGKHSYAYITLRLLEFGLAARHKAALAFGMMNFSVLLISRHGAYAEAEQHAQAALQLAQQIDDTQLRLRIDYSYGSMVAHWTQPVAVGLQALERSYELALANADKVYIGLALSFSFRARIMAGETVPALLQLWERTDPVIQQINSVPIVAMYAMNRQWLRAWQGRTVAPARLAGEDFDDHAFEAHLQSLPAKSPYHWFGLLQAILAYMHGELALAQRWIVHADANLEAVTGQFAIPEHHFWRTLILHAAGDHQALPAGVQKMAEWGAACPANFGHRALLLRAELLRSRGQVDAALAAYLGAIDQARQRQHGLLLALALERIGDYFLDLKLQHQARAYLQEAVGAYQDWGAPTKVHQLRARYPEHAVLPGHVDGDAVTNATQAILSALGDIHLDGLLRQLLPLLARTTGASRVAAFIVREGELMLEGQSTQRVAGDDYPLPPALQHAEDYPAQLISDSCALHQPMVLAAPAHHPQYGAHACWHRHPAAAVLCLPILRHGRLLGALYMEREQGDSFAATLSLLESLLRQLGTAIENALLYADLEQQIVERSRAEKVAREGERRWRTFLEHARMAVMTLDLSGAIEYVNPFLCELFGYAEDELIGKDWTRVLLSPQEQGAGQQAMLRAELQAHGHFNSLARLRTREGQERLIAWSSSLLRDPDGRPIGSIGIGTDMTDQRNAERALRQLNEELEQRVVRRTSDLAAANQELDSFAYSISHDLRAPLRSIDGFSQALTEDYGAGLDAQALDYLRRVRNAAHRMGGMIDAMLHMSRQTRGALATEEIDLSAMAQEVLEELRQRAPQRSVRLLVAPGLRARADARLMRVTLDNLLGNAWKYSVGAAAAEIAFEAEQREGEMVYCVRDNGAGFDMARAGKLFHAFQRLHADVEGHGIGLATAQRIIHRHGGRIWAQAEPGKGAAFFFTLAS
ncbi:AAA family ATPase [Noviherbaspirillum sedimenti]|uniref:histidine kinase n=1 Tax=Noviherbaspirillum sedimenti TaxID=2320865 RepID=A0A3A3GLI6_9BURK|nr:AAA family ATPase [Noviherbaspirillum sedimenti]RJG03136.1 PAS domain S-box protein [Noviherbaspirillum sedimenti]